MDNASYFIDNRALFGSYPTQERVDELENLGVRYFINLTFDDEKKISPYKTCTTVVRFPIRDRRTPRNWYEFSLLVTWIKELLHTLKLQEKIYIHCKGGHGRSGVLVSCLLCLYNNYTPEQALEDTKLYHSHRTNLKDRWKRIGSPQTLSQKNFVRRFFSKLVIYPRGKTRGFLLTSRHTVVHPSLGTFLKASLLLSAMVELVDDDADMLFSEMLYYVCWLKISQHEVIRNNLINTGFRHLVLSNGDTDITLECLEKIRYDLYKQMIEF